MLSWSLRFFFIAFCVIGACVCQAAEYTLLKVYDGDTVKLAGPDGEFKLRLTGIDAPERNQAYGKKSRRALNKLCKTKSVTISVNLTGMDKYKRYLGRLYCNGIDASLHLTQQGLAWHNYWYSSDINIFLAQREAQKQAKGLWQQPNPTPPWLWRRQHQRR